MATKTTTTDSARSSSKPRKPLSAYNLFYRYKRAKLVEANGTTKEAVCNLTGTPAGLENYPLTVRSMIPPDRLDEFRRTNIRLALGGDLFSKDTRNRPHRKSKNGGFKMSFVEMNRLMVDNWKVADKFSKAVFQELADDARRLYQQQLIEYSLAHHIIHRDANANANANAAVVNTSPPRETPKINVQVVAPQLDFAQFQYQQAHHHQVQISVDQPKAPAAVASPVKLSGPVKSDVELLAWEPLPFHGIAKPSPPSYGHHNIVSHTHPEAVPSSPNAVQVKYNMEPHHMSIVHPVQVAARPYTSPVKPKACYPVAVVTPASRYATSGLLNGVAGSSPANSNSASVPPAFLPPPFLGSDTRKGSSSFAPRPSAWSGEPTKIVAGTPGAGTGGSYGSSNCYDLSGTGRSPSPVFFSSFPNPPVIHGPGNNNNQTSPSSGFDQLDLSDHNINPVDDFAVDDFADLIAILADDA